MPALRDFLEKYASDQRRRATGGLYSLSGFDFQLRVYLAKFVDSLSSEQEPPLLEAFSDIAEETGCATVITQVKRTLSKKTIREASLEIAVIEEFFDEYEPDLGNRIRYQIVGSRKDEHFTDLSAEIWNGVEVPDDAKDRDGKNLRLRKLHQQGRLLAPRLEPDPWQRLLKAIFHRLRDPFGFADQALQLCLNRGIAPANASELAEQIARLYAEHRDAQKTRLLAELLVESDFSSAFDPKRGTLLGQTPTISDLRKQRVMPLPERIHAIVALLEQDVVVFDRQYSPFIFHHEAQTIIPAESVYAAFEAKQSIDADEVSYAQKKVASVRRLHRTSLPIPHAGGTYPPKVPARILGGLLTFESEWKPPLGAPLTEVLGKGVPDGRLDLGCVAAHGIFGCDEKNCYTITPQGKPATAFLFELIARLQTNATVPMIDIRAYAQWLATEPPSIHKAASKVIVD